MMHDQTDIKLYINMFNHILLNFGHSCERNLLVKSHNM